MKGEHSGLSESEQATWVVAMCVRPGKESLGLGITQLFGWSVSEKRKDNWWKSQWEMFALEGKAGGSSEGIQCEMALFSSHGWISSVGGGTFSLMGIMVYITRMHPLSTRREFTRLRGTESKCLTERRGI